MLIAQMFSTIILSDNSIRLTENIQGWMVEVRLSGSKGFRGTKRQLKDINIFHMVIAVNPCSWNWH